VSARGVACAYGWLNCCFTLGQESELEVLMLLQQRLKMYSKSAKIMLPAICVVPVSDLRY